MIFYSFSGTFAPLRAAALACLIPLAACASFDGQPRPILPSDIEIPPAYAVPAALETYYGANNEDQRKNFRDTVIGIYMAAADANFIQFRRELSRQMKGSNFGLGLAVVGLTNAASIAAEKTANALSAGAAGLTGAQGKLSSEVYFEKTLPALFAALDANRTHVRTNIMERMKEGDSYNLTAAFSDLASYEAAASMDQAIETMTAEASDKAAEEQARFENVVGVGGIVSAPERPVLKDVTSRITALMNSNSLDTMKKISAELGLPTNVDIRQQTIAAITKLTTLGEGGLDKFLTDLKTNQGVDLRQ